MTIHVTPVDVVLGLALDVLIYLGARRLLRGVRK